MVPRLPPFRRARRAVAADRLVLLLAGAACGAPPPTAGAPPRPVACLPPLDHARHGHCLEALADGTLLVFGGFAEAAGAPERGTRQCFALPPEADCWERRADLPWPLAFAGSVCAEGAAYAIGDGVLRYDAVADRWEEVVPRGRLPASHFACAPLAGGAFVLGGFPAERAGPWRLELPAGEVRRLPEPPGFAPGDHLHIAANLGGRLHLVGGLEGDSGRRLRSHLVLDGDRWRGRSRPPAGMWAKFAVVAWRGERLWCFTETGGWQLDADRDVWGRRRGLEQVLAGELLAMPQAWVDAASIHVVGGAPTGERRPVLLRYDIAADRWRDCTARGTGTRGGDR